MDCEDQRQNNSRSVCAHNNRYRLKSGRLGTDREKKSENIAMRFCNTCLARYPQTERVIQDNGREFTGQEFQGILYNLGMKSSGTTAKNPQSNAICKQMHQTVATILKKTIKASPPQNVDNVNNLAEDALAAAMHSLHATVSTTLKAMPGGLAFSRNMLLNVPLIADWKAIQEHREQLANKALIKSNKKRINYDYCIGKKILK